MICPNCGTELHMTDETPGEYNLTPAETAEANEMVDYIIEQAKAPRIRYLNREKIPENYLPLCDAYVEACGKDKDGHYNQEPTKAVLMDWMVTFEDWVQARIRPEHIKAAWQASQGRFSVGRPGSLTVTARAMKSKTAERSAPIPTIIKSKLELLRAARDE